MTYFFFSCMRINIHHISLDKIAIDFTFIKILNYMGRIEIVA